MLAYWFGIHVMTDMKLIWLALLALNTALMTWLILKVQSRIFRVYLGMAGIASLLQLSPWWGLPGEVVLAIATLAWLWTQVPDADGRRIFATGTGLLLVSGMLIAAPLAWPAHDPWAYFIRMYVAVFGAGVAIGMVVLTWSLQEKLDWFKVLLIAWFGAIIFAGLSTNWAYWTKAVLVKGVWTFCLLTWVLLYRVRAGSGVDHRSATEIPRRFLPGLPASRLGSARSAFREQSAGHDFR